MKISELVTYLEEYAPKRLAESYDNVGLLVGESDTQIESVLLTLDVTDAVLDEAIENGCGMIISHHPIWFSARKNLIGDDWVSRLILKAIRHRVALYALHTNLDNMLNGVNRIFVDLLKLQNVRILAPLDPANTPNLGAGIIGDLPKSVEKHTFLTQLKELFGLRALRYADAEIINVSRVAACGGSGAFLITKALKLKADIFLSGDIGYHKFFDGENAMIIADLGHHETERFTPQLIAEVLIQKFPKFAVYLSKVNTNPIKTLV